ncbi:hypothetical protein [Methylophaga thiooxydans]|uniref:Uncharacterized protein n=1 Tax=Methylophaga thiooxydans DMS010 TaxID=637616 RepID=C0N5J2_9GAMM|nr:hypothetical protein [Methylophaga thiooxydans]EEF79985.1 hypothetical protein MDMS009_1536 [Methylophaga thiooxydans DMS010]
MKKIYHKNHRAIIKKHIRLINKVNDGESLTLSGYDDFFKFIATGNVENITKNQEALNEEFSLCYLYAASVRLLSFTFSAQKPEHNLIPSDWLGEDARPNPNLVFETLLSQISDYSYSVIKLAESGLDNPARSLVRVLSELVQQTLCLAANVNDVREYVAAHEDHEATKVWYQLFGKGKLDKKLTTIESALGLTEDLIFSLREERTNTHKFYSQNIHHSFTASVVGSRSWAFSDESCRDSFFGGHSSSLRAPLSALTRSLWYFNIMFLAIFNNLHGFKVPDIKDSFWFPYFAIRDASNEIFLEGLKPSS